MTKATTSHVRDRYAMLKGVYEDTLSIGDVRRRTRPAAGTAPRPRKRSSWVLLAAALVLAPAFGYLGQSGHLSLMASRTETGASATGSPGALPAVAVAYDSPVPLTVSPEDLGAPETGTWSDFHRLLRDDHASLSQVFGLGIKTIVIDAGHGGRDPGAIGHHGVREKDITLDVALRLRDRLRRYGGYRILMTRDTDRTVRLNQRVAFANRHHADLFVSIHVNSFPDVRVKTIETYYFGAPPDAAAIELAKLENTDSQYSMAAFNSMLEKIGLTMKQQESIALAKSIQHNLYENIRKVSRRMRDFGVKTAPFVVLLGVNAPSVLAEISCITNPDEERKLNTPAYRETMASFLAKGVREYLRQKQSLTAGDERDGRERNG